MKNKSKCTFQDFEINSSLKKKKKLGRFLNEMVCQFTEKENQLSYIFVTDDYLLNMNQSYLKHDTYTDIITFDLSEKNTSEIIGEIYISIDRVLENAEKEKVKYKHELYRVMIHGALHLCGFKDKTKKDKSEMTEQENIWLEKYLTQK